MKTRLLVLTMLWCSSFLLAQDYFPKNDGVKSKNNNYTAFTNAKIYVTPNQVIENGTLLIQNGKVVQAGKSVTIPKNTVTIDVSGKSIYPSFIDIYSDFGIKKPERAPGRGRTAEYEPTREGFYWNDHIMPETNAIATYKFDAKKAKELREAGFGIVNTHLQDGIARGTGILIALNSEGTDANRVLDDKSAQYFSFNRSITKKQAYPTSLMGTTALLRQMYNDMDWYAKGNIDTKDRSLEALIANKNLPQIIEAKDKFKDLLADKIGDANGIQYTILAGGDEYESITEIKATNAKYILPLNFPVAFDVSNPYQAGYVSLDNMRHWNLAPSNPKVLSENGVQYAITLYDSKSTKTFKENLLKAITYGLSKTKALEALTTIPAQILGKSSQIGSLKSGSYANFLIASGDIFDKNTTLYENWVQGQKSVVNDINLKDIRGDYDLIVANKTFKLNIAGQTSKPKATIKEDTIKLDSKIKYVNNWLDLSFSTKNDELYRMTSLASNSSDELSGRLILPTGEETSFKAIKTKSFSEKEKKEKEKEALTLMPIHYPNIGYGSATKPKQETILFKNATVWTSEDDGILKNTDLLIKNGKISKIGKDLSAGGAKVIDATGKHVTAGVIDEHSHIGLYSVNEAGQNSSAEVTMEDAVNSEDMNIYRNLGGGVTTSQLLHGSANPIGGRSAIIKLKWGETADKMIYSNSPKFIKFALGENVKQSNWGSFSRFPQTRMGVEQVYMNYFQRGKEYDELKKSGKPYRYDEEMEVIAQILNGEVFISCHSYVQSEINMLMKVAEKFNFKINTFTHILEGYKVADKMAEHGVGGSTFSDWWAYKYEVNDAIPYNAAIMHSQGVTVAINSDDREMSRRLNQEAGKIVKYGDVSEEEAWKMVTINPAKLLHLDDRTGSLKVGKDADVVLWTDHPLSVYAKAEKTIIDGTIYFDIEKDKQQRKLIQEERNILINMMLKEKESGKPTQKPRKKLNKEFHCDSL
ncbi:amidohydrolase family protein [Cellulophaga baltica]|uniref:amidohydrolase family protein n=1 Tax=Cellulophaga TaxID=104264 RepID=UPI001C07C4F6|nr:MULTISPECIES: amidohydrolase family protein [Cellulophaga]MBU2996515.1 amidohydrolase family protein [Cellulophaga baltica]MDO6767909.1 amidohydrolase family protein [Cellulophaga sp. 1_MG-2023]